LTNRVQSRHEEFFNDCCEAIEHSETREDKNDPPAVFDPTGHDIVRAAIGSNLRGQHRQYRKCRFQNCHPHAHAFALVKEREIAEDEKSEGTPRAIRTQARVLSSSLSRNGESEARTPFICFRLQCSTNFFLVFFLAEELLMVDRYENFDWCILYSIV